MPPVNTLKRRNRSEERECVGDTAVKVDLRRKIKQQGKSEIKKKKGDVFDTESECLKWRWMWKKKWFLKPPTEWGVISFHMYAIKAVLPKLGWVATLHPRHTAVMICFDRLFCLYSKWQVSDTGLLCGDNERWICMKQRVPIKLIWPQLLICGTLECDDERERQAMGRNARFWAKHATHGFTQAGVAP